MFKRSLLLIILSIFFILTVYAYNFYQNNKDLKFPENLEIENALNDSIGWLQSNRKKIESDHNPALWWMIKEASKISNIDKLNTIYKNYEKNYLHKNPPNVWTPYFSEYYKPYVPDVTLLSNLRDYQIFFIYALSCDSDLGGEPVIQKQLKADFCSFHFIHPRCITHQLMSIRLMEKRNCNDQNLLGNISSKLADIIWQELTWDFRVGDAYIQRTLMLAESDNINLIKPAWIRRILDAQNIDGGWDDIHPVVTFPNSYILGLSSTLPVLKKSKSNFHTTAQAIWLLSLLLNNDIPDS